MKKIIKRIVCIVCVVALCLTFVACGKNKEAESFDQAYGENVELNLTADFAPSESKNKNSSMFDTEELSEGSTTGSLKTVYSGNRKIVRNAELSLSTEKYGETIKAVETAVSNISGYIESSSENKYGTYNYLQMTVRVPSDKLDEFLNAIDGVATVTSKSISSDDITNSYADTESHLAALKTEQETLLGLLEKANNLSEILEIQDRLTEVRSNIEYYQSMMNTYNDELSYSTVRMGITEVAHEVETGVGFWANIGAGLKESLFSIVNGIKNFFSWLIINIPYFIIIAVVILVLCAIIKKVRLKRKNKKISKDVENAGQADNRDVSE